MKTTIKWMTGLILLLAVIVPHGTASAGGGGGGSYKFKGMSADAFFSSTEPSGCIVTEVGVFASEGILSSKPGPGNPAPFASLYIYRYDNCTGETLLAAEGYSLADLDFQVNKKLNTAALNTTVTVVDSVSGASFDVDINLDWAANGRISRNRSQTHYDSPGCKIHTLFSGSSRPAEASGSVSDGATNFTPSPSSGAFISETKTGSLVIGCN